MTKLLYILGITFVLISESAKAAMCINGYPTVGEEYARAAHVVDAQVIRIDRSVSKPFSYGDKSYREPVDLITVKVRSSFKGPSTKQLRFESRRTSAAFPARIGNRYLLFISRDANSANLYVDTCGSSQPIARVDRNTLGALKKLSVSPLNK